MTPKAKTRTPIVAAETTRQPVEAPATVEAFMRALYWGFGEGCSASRGGTVR